MQGFFNVMLLFYFSKPLTHALKFLPQGYGLRIVMLFTTIALLVQYLLADTQSTGHILGATTAVQHFQGFSPEVRVILTSGFDGLTDYLVFVLFHDTIYVLPFQTTSNLGASGERGCSNTLFMQIPCTLFVMSNIGKF